MKNNGFTLIELLAVIVILGIITGITVPTVNKAIKKGKEELYDVQINNIELGAKSWAAENAFDLPEVEGQLITLTLGQLKMAGFVEIEIKNPVTNKLFPNNMLITITRHMNNYIYKVLEDTGTSAGGDNNLDLTQPTIILNGEASVLIEYGKTYEDLGVIARSSAGINITDQVITEIRSNNQIVPMVDTTRFGQYIISYTVNDNGNMASVDRTVTVVDSVPPILTIPGDISIYDSEVDTFDVMAGVSATDNSGSDVTIITTGNVSSIPGTYTVTYTATDIKGNETVKQRIITVEEYPYTYFDLDKGVNTPKLATGMTPIKWNGSDWVSTTIDDLEWYDYTNKQWANAQTVDGSFWVWIPRYAYQITNNYHTNTPGAINIKFLTDNTNEIIDGSIVDDVPSYSADSQINYVTHPAFTFGSTEITGIWVAKFEPSVADQTNLCYTNPSSSNCNNINLVPKIIPNAYSWRYMKMGTAFDISLAMKEKSVYGWQTNEVDTHMMKNTEWGAVTYLAKSSYGKDDEIWINPANNFTTGCTGDSVSSSLTIGCINTYETSSGVNGSSTGNVYGVYDISGGAWEGVSAYVDNGNGYLNINGLSIINAAAKYKNVYFVATDTGQNNYESNATMFGDAVYETSSASEGLNSWYGDYAYMPNGTNPWVNRGGYYNNGTYTGSFAFGGTNGAPDNSRSFRPIVIINQ